VRRGSLYLSLGFYFISFKMGRERKSHSLRQVRCDYLDINIIHHKSNILTFSIPLCWEWLMQWVAWPSS
jgi:hypothetical protein